MTGRLAAVYRVFRDARAALTLDELADRLGVDYDGGPRQLAPLVWWLVSTGRLVELPGSPWHHRRYGVPSVWGTFRG